MLQEVSGTSSSSLQALWSSFSEVVEESGSSSLSFARSSVKKVNWVIENRGGLAWLTGLVMVPSQFLGPNAARSNEIIDGLARSPNFTIERCSLSIGDGATSVTGVVYYPKDWDRSDSSRCILYHNPNGITVSGYFEEARLSWTPSEFLKLAKCPIIMYDYRGTGLSSENTSSSSFSFRPTYETVVVDGEAVLRYALDRFQHVGVVGSSLGGGVATVSLERHLTANPADAARVSLTNHDSFSTTARVVMPQWPRVADWTGWALGGLLDAETSMKSLIKREIPITVLCHLNDPVIPEGARMAEVVQKLPSRSNVSFIYSPDYGHANLSPSMIDELARITSVAQGRLGIA